MPKQFYTQEQAFAALADSPARIAAAVKGLPTGHLKAAPSAGEWSVNDVLAHLRACGDVWGGHIVHPAVAAALGQPVAPLEPLLSERA